MVGTAIQTDTAVAELEASEHRHSQGFEPVRQDVQDVPSPVGLVVESGEQAQGDTPDPGE